MHDTEGFIKKQIVNKQLNNIKIMIKLNFPESEN